jgi:hypothetical protein
MHNDKGFVLLHLVLIVNRSASCSKKRQYQAARPPAVEQLTRLSPIALIITFKMKKARLNTATYG